MSLERLTFNATRPIYSSAATRRIEQAAAAALPPHTLMQRAGLAVASLACEIAPQAKVIWLACGPGNNGGDGLEAAMNLCAPARDVVVTWLGSDASCPADSLASFKRARDAGVRFSDSPPAHWDLAVDALLGIGIRPKSKGASLAPEAQMSDWLALMNESGKPVLHVDVPSGFSVDTGQRLDATDLIAARADSMPENGHFRSKNTL